jgi:hypothetical protein
MVTAPSNEGAGHIIVKLGPLVTKGLLSRDLFRRLVHDVVKSGSQLSSSAATMALALADLVVAGDLAPADFAQTIEIALS